MSVRLLLEDQMRNTAVAMTLAALAADCSDDLQLYCPADHLIPDVESFLAALTIGIPAANEGAIVTIGIHPSTPNSAYGYLVQGDETWPGTFRVSQFIEKPDVEKAASLMSEESVFWNAGIFLCRADTLIEAMRHHQPEILASCQEGFAKGKNDATWDFFRPDSIASSACSSISFDKAVMELHDDVVMVPFMGQWTDVGSWDAVSALTSADS